MLNTILPYLRSRGLVLPRDTTRANFLPRLETALKTTVRLSMAKRVRLSQSAPDPFAELAAFYAEILEVFLEAGDAPSRQFLESVKDELAEAGWQLKRNGKKIVAEQSTRLSFAVVWLSTQDWVPYKSRSGRTKFKKQVNGNWQYRDTIPGSAKARVAQRTGDVSVRKAALKDSVRQYAEEHRLSDRDKGNAKRSLKAFQRYYGDNALGRLEEVQEELTALLAKQIAPITKWKAAKKLASLGLMVDMLDQPAPAQPQTSEVEAETDAPNDLPPPESAKSGEKRTSKDGTQWMKAPAGGMESPVNGKFYKGGQWVPIHGLTPEREGPTPKKKPPQGGDVNKPNDDAEGGGGKRTPRGPMSPEEIEAERARRENQKKWNEINAGPLGRMQWLGSSPNSKAFESRPRTKDWMEWVESVGSDKIADLISKLESVVFGRIEDEFRKHRERGDVGFGPVADDAEEWEKEQIKAQAEDTKKYGGRSASKHEREHPGSFYAHALVSEFISGTGAPGTVDNLHELNAILNEAQQPSNWQSGKLDQPAPVQPEAKQPEQARHFTYPEEEIDRYRKKSPDSSLTTSTTDAKISSGDEQQPVTSGSGEMMTTQSKVDAIVSQLDGKEWRSGDKHRVYFNNLPELFGLKTNRYNTGNISDATLDGEPISNSKASRIIEGFRNTKIWYDVAEDKVKFIPPSFGKEIGEDEVRVVVNLIREKIADLEAKQ